MSLKRIIRKGDTTTHGGVVLEGVDSFDVMGKSASRIGHMVACPKCKGVFPIIEGVNGFSMFGDGVATEGMKTSCGAELIASQDQLSLEVFDKVLLSSSDIEGIIKNSDHATLVASSDKNLSWRVLKTTEVVIMTNMYKSDMVGNHAGMFLDPEETSSTALLYDPSGSYCAGNGRYINGQFVHRPRIDIFYEREVDINDYVAYQKECDETPKETLMVELWRFQVTKKDGDIIRKRIESRDTNGFAKCATRIAQAIEGIGPFKDLQSAIMYNTPVELRMSMMMLKKLGK